MTEGRGTGGTPPRTATHLNALPVGARLGEFEIREVLGEGGFGIVYRAFDHSLGIDAALKEYLPSALAYRQDGQTILPRSAQHRPTFEAGLASFLQEARVIAQFDHPALVRVRRIWEANGTAYMAMAFYSGPTLRGAVRHDPSFASQPQLVSLLRPLFDGVGRLHARRCYHRDIAPDNIIVRPGGDPVLIDFGAARTVIGGMTQALTAVLKPGYAPIEQYADDAQLAQGPWTDVYGFAATLCFAITGKPPPTAAARALSDTLVPFAVQAPAGYDGRFLAGIDLGLAVRPQDRPQSLRDFADALGVDLGDGDERTIIVPRHGTGAASSASPLTAAPAPTSPQTVPPTSPQTVPPMAPPTGRAQGPDATGGRGPATGDGTAPRATTRTALAPSVSVIARDEAASPEASGTGADEPASIEPDSPRAAARDDVRSVTGARVEPPTPASRATTVVAAPSKRPAAARSRAPRPMGAVLALVVAAVGAVAAYLWSTATPPPAAPSAVAEGPAPVPAPAAATGSQPSAPAIAPLPSAVPPAGAAARNAPPGEPRRGARPPASSPSPPSSPPLAPPSTPAVSAPTAPAAPGPTPAIRPLPPPTSTVPTPGAGDAGAAAAALPPAAPKDARGQYELGRAYEIGNGVPRDPVAALRWFRRAAAAGYRPAMVALAAAYEAGRGTAASVPEAIPWYEKAAALGDAVAQYNLGAIHGAGRGVPRNLAVAADWYRKAAESGYAPAQNSLGRMYENGWGVPRDDAAATRLFELAAAQGHAGAENNLGVTYATGRGVGRNDVLAAAWYRKAADHGNAAAQANLGHFYESGRGVFRDPAEAFRLYSQSALQGYPGGQFRLGRAHELGIGTAPDAGVALFWYRKAAAGGQADAAARVKALEPSGR